MKKLRICLVSVLCLMFLPILILAQPLESQVEISVSAQIGEEEPPPPAAPPWAPVPPPPAIVVFKGRAYPNAFLTVLRNGTVAATFFAKPSGLFEKKLTGMRAGVYTFEIWAQDTEGRKSPSLSFTVNILEGMTTTISGIFMPPTIELSSTQVARGRDINIFGQAFPGSEIKIFVDPGAVIKETKTNSQGKWNYKLNTAPLPEREYMVRARAFYGEGEFSPFSQTVSFFVLPIACWGADLNFDRFVNTIDFSILLYFWRQAKPVNICADINLDGIVNVIDFSIMMYEWTG